MKKFYKIPMTERIVMTEKGPLIDTLKLEDIDDDIYFSEKYSDYILTQPMEITYNVNIEGRCRK